MVDLLPLEDFSGYYAGYDGNINKRFEMCDITMCCNRDCPIRNKCYRYRAVPDDYQSFAFFKYQPISDTNDEECEYFWRVDEIKDRTIPTSIADNRYDRDWKWEGLKSARQE